MEENNQRMEEMEQEPKEEGAQSYSYQYEQSAVVAASPKKGNPALGTIGAIVGALIGGVLWVGIYQVGFIAGIAGFVTVICAMKGFEMLGKQPVGKLGTVLCVLISLAVILLANCLCYSIEIYKAFAEDYYLTFSDCVALLPSFLEDGDVLAAFLKDLLIGYVLTFVASFSAIGAAFKKH